MRVILQKCYNIINSYTKSNIQQTFVATEEVSWIIHKVQWKPDIWKRFSLFHINDQTKKDFSYHYHDFHKIIVFISGKVTYHIEEEKRIIEPRDILLGGQGAIHKPGPIHRFRMSAIFSGFVMIFLPGIEYLLSNKRSQFQPWTDSALRRTSERSASRNETDLTRNKHWRYSTQKCAVTQFTIYQPDFSSRKAVPGQKNIFSGFTVNSSWNMNRNLSENLSIEIGAIGFSKYHMMRVKMRPGLYYPQLYYCQ